MRSLFFGRRPIPVFHHIPKCGGSSLRQVLGRWYNIHSEYREINWSPQEYIVHPKIPIYRLPKSTCIIGHWEVPDFYLEDRYPEILKNKDEFFLFTFLRDPLEVKISLYYFEIKRNRQTCKNLEERIFKEDNYLSDRFPCDESNYQKILDRYDFIGFVEDYQYSLDRLATVLKKPKQLAPLVNKSERDFERHLSEDVISEFKERNQLDYKIYDYALSKLSH